MSGRALHQFVPTFEPGAMGAHMLEVQRTLRAEGWESEIFAEFMAPGFGRARRFVDYGKRVPARAGDVLLYQAGIGSVVADWLHDRSETLAVNYHNFTPAGLLEPWDPGAAYGAAWGRDQLRKLAPRTALGIAVSAYNQAELVEAGYRRTVVAPILLDPEQFDADVDEDALARLKDDKVADGCTWLFVGRLSANKAQHDVVKAFAAYRRLYDPRARLHLVGGGTDGRYGEAVASFVDALGLGDAVRFAGGVPNGVRNAHYQVADVFVCLSDHEGFCVPVLEAWHHRLPVVAHAAAALPETVGRGGLLLPNKDPLTVAAAVHLVAGDPALAERLAAAGAARLADFSIDRSRARFLEAIASIQP